MNREVRIAYDVLMANFRSISTILICAMIVFGQGQLAVGQDEGRPSLLDQRLDGLIASLEDESWAVREEATIMIGNPNEGFELDMLAEVLERGDLSDELRARLRIAARALFGLQTQAGLGVGFGAARDGGIEIASVVPDVDEFPAAGVLMPGDLIVGAEGRPLISSDELRAMILSHEPGETLLLLIQRGQEVLDLELPLGSYKLLRGAAPIVPSIADRAIEIRWARRGIGMPAPESIGGGISAENWVDAGYPEPSGSFRASNARRSPRIVSRGPGGEVYVGVGTVVRGRIEPWSNRETAAGAMGQARRITLSLEMNVLRTRIGTNKRRVEFLEQLAQDDPGNADVLGDLSEVRDQLRTDNRELERLTKEFVNLKPSP